MILSLKTFLKFFGMMKHNRSTEEAKVIFPEKSPFGVNGPNLSQNYTTLYHINYSRDF